MYKLTSLVGTFIISLFSFQVNAQWEKLSDVYTTEVFVADTNIFIGNIYLSRDFGQSWTSIKNNLPDYFIDNIGKCDSNKLVCSCGRFIYTSKNWTDWDLVEQVSNNVTSMVIDSMNIYVGVEFNGGIHASIDNGNSWSDISSNLSNRYITSVAIQDTTLLVSVFGSDQIYRSDNHGESWNAFNHGAMIDAIFSLVKYTDFYAGGNEWIFRLNNDEWIPVYYTGAQVSDFAFHNSYLCGVGEKVYISSDSGLTWATIETPYTNFYLKAVEIYKGYILAGNSTGLYRYPLPQIISNSNDAIETQELDIYPNPCREVFYVESTENLKDNISVFIRSLNGSLIRSSTFSSHDVNVPMNVNDLLAGLYFVQIIQGNNSVIKKLIIE